MSVFNNTFANEGVIGKGLVNNKNTYVEWKLLLEGALNQIILVS